MDIPALKAAAEAKLVSSLEEKKAELIASLGAKKTNNSVYTTTSYSNYSTAYDAIVTSINNATTISELNSINVSALKAAAESKLVTLISEKKASLKTELGSKKANSGYTSSSYAAYSAAYDEILASIDSATTMAALNAIDISALKAAAEAMLKTEESDADKDTITSLDGSASKDVLLYYSNAGISPDPIYSVDVVWTDLSFTYTEGTTRWNPEEHKYNDAVTTPAWKDSTGEITVTNHSNGVVDVRITFAQTATPNGTAALTVSPYYYTLESAEGKTVANAPSMLSTVTATGTPEKDGDFGTITVEIQKVN